MSPEPTTADTGHQALREALEVSFRLLRWAMVFLVAVYLLSGVFVVRQHERAFVLVFGKIAGLGGERLKGPGIHWTLPTPFAEIVRVSTERVRSLESSGAWYDTTGQDLLGNEPPAGTSLRPGADGYTVTADANLMHSRWALRYTVSQPEPYAFGFGDMDRILRNELDHAVAKCSAQFPVDRALRSDIEAFRAAVDTELRRRCEELGLGVQVVRTDVLAAIPPRQVAAAFNAVVSAEQERSRTISAARAAATRVVNEARGEAAQILAEGETYKTRLVSEVSADADYFDKIYAKYVQEPDVTYRTLLQDGLRRALSGVEQKYIVYETGGGKQELRLLLGRESQPLTIQPGN
jgi:modulator of FtsH protease HflK